MIVARELTILQFMVMGMISIPRNTKSITKWITKTDHKLDPRFPFGEFFNTSASSLLNHAKLKYSCDVKPQSGCCRCDKTCMVDGTCCIDTFWKHSKVILSSYKEDFVKNVSAVQRRTKCLEFFPGLRKNGHKSERYLMISSCPGISLSEHHGLCESDKRDVLYPPVVGDDGFLYKNQHCARCNAVSGFETPNAVATCSKQI